MFKHKSPASPGFFYLQSGDVLLEVVLELLFGQLLSIEKVEILKDTLDDLSIPDRMQYDCRDITLTGYDRPLIGADPAFTQKNLRIRVSWTAMAEKGAIDTIFTLYSYDPHED